MKTFEKFSQSKVLVCVSGMTPAVITETLFALATQKHFIPDEIHVITTVKGKEKIEQCILGKNGHFISFMNDYLPGKHIDFDVDHIHLIKLDGKELEDITNDDENRAAADAIYKVLRQIKSASSTQMHVSIAGGRKSMGFYMGHAFSLVADGNDELSHVLVTPAIFENPRIDFYYPPTQPWTREIDGKIYNSADAIVTLAEVAALKLGSLFDTEVPQKAKESFAYAVKLMQATISPPIVEICFENEKGFLKILDQEIELSNLEFAVFFIHALGKKHAKEFKNAGAMNLNDIKPYMQKALPKEFQVEACLLDDKTTKSKIKSKISKKIGPVGKWFQISKTKSIIRIHPNTNQENYVNLFELIAPADYIKISVSDAIKNKVYKVIEMLDAE